MSRTSYASDLEFLKSHTDVIELSAAPGAEVAVVPAFQGRVMTSTLAGDEGAGYGWLNRPFIELESEEDDAPFNNYGGEDRFWLGPEAGQYALFFTGGQPFDLDHWKAPPGFSAGAWDVAAGTGESVTMTREFTVGNYAGTDFQCAVTRTINVLSADRAAGRLGAAIPEDLKVVAFESHNTLVNAGRNHWTRDAGLVNIWILGMMKALANGRTIIPLTGGGAAEPKARMNYFCDLPAEYGRICDDYVWFKVDGLFRAKIGVAPARARNVFGSYDIDNAQLTIVQYTLTDNAAELPYTNSAWELQDEPFAGDAINSYNDPGTDDGRATFFELETNAPAAELAPGGSMTHVHRTCHFEGNFEALNALSVKVLGVDLNDLT